MDGLPLNEVDIVVLTVIGISTLIAIVRGFVRELFGLVGWAAASLVTYLGLPLVTPLVEPYVSQPLLSKAIAGAILFISSLIIFAIITHFVVKAVHAVKLGLLDRTLGMAFGVLRGAFLLSLAYFLYGTLLQLEEDPDWIVEAKTGRLLEIGAGTLQGLAPDLAADLNQFSQKNLAALHESPAERQLEAKGVFSQLSEEERNYANRLLKSLPENKQEHSVDDLLTMPPNEAGLYMMGLIRPYQQLQREGGIPESIKNMDSDELISLVKALREVARGERSKESLKEEGGYQSRQVQELQRLVDGLQQKNTTTDAPSRDIQAINP